MIIADFAMLKVGAGNQCHHGRADAFENTLYYFVVFEVVEK